MLNKKLFDDLAKHLVDALPANMEGLKGDMEAHFHDILQRAFAKCDLIPRDEFDSQSKVLARTREKLEILESRVQRLEAQKNKD